MRPVSARRPSGWLRRPRGRCGSSSRAEDQARVPDPDPVPIVEDAGLGDPLFVQKGAVGAPQVLEDETTGLPGDCRVVPGDLRVVNGYLVVQRTPDAHGTAQLELPPLGRSRVDLQPGHGRRRRWCRQACLSSLPPSVCRTSCVKRSSAVSAEAASWNQFRTTLTASCHGHAPGAQNRCKWPPTLL